MKRLRLTVRRVRELRVSRTQVSRELIQCVVSNENAGRHIEDAVIGVELLDCLATADGVAFTENLLEVAVQKFTNPIRHRVLSPCRSTKGRGRPPRDKER